ncbi:MAG: hypothetical protein ABI383_11680 [Acidobacteriaceae bacterium]
MQPKSARLTMSMFAAAICSTAFLLTPLSVHAQDHQVTKYKLYDIGPPAGNLSTFFNFDAIGGQFTPSPLNSYGHLAGTYSDTPNTAAGFLWERDNFKVLPSLPNAETVPHGGSNTTGINDSGVVTGFSSYGAISPLNGQAFYHAVSWRHGEVRDLGDLGGGDSWATYITSRGLVIGFAYNATPDPYSYYGTQYHATTWSDGRIRDLGTLGGTDSQAWAANSRGDVIGISLLNTAPVPPFNQPREDAFIWSRGHMRDLGTLGGNFSTPTAINRRGQVTVLSFDNTNQQYQSFLWCDGHQSVLAGLGGVFVEATTLNDYAISTGAATDPTNTNFLAEVWLPTGEGFALGAVAGDTGSVGLGINNQGVIVGGSGSVTLFGNTYAHAFVWQYGSLADLNTLVPAGSPLTLNVAYAINDRGMIAGMGTNSNGDQHAFVLVPDDDDHNGNGSSNGNATRGSARPFATAASAPAAPGSSIHTPSPAARLLRQTHKQDK